jgi:dolichol kinase
MDQENNVIYRKGVSEGELQKAKERTEEAHVKSHADKGAIAGAILFYALSKLIGASTLVSILLIGFGAGLGSLIGYLEALFREKRLKEKNKG